MGEKVICPKCSHHWKTKSKLIYTTCPSCQRKFRRVKEEQKEKEEEEEE